MNITKVKVTPKSNRAKNKFFNQMGGNPVCVVEQVREDGLMFLVSEHNKDAFMWVCWFGDDNWSVEKL